MPKHTKLQRFEIPCTLCFDVELPTGLDAESERRIAASRLKVSMDTEDGITIAGYGLREHARIYPSQDHAGRIRVSDISRAD